jgi:hypothetical protein
MKLNIFAILVGFCYVIVNTKAVDVQYLNQNNNISIDRQNSSLNNKNNNFLSATSNLFQSFYEKLSKLL